MERPGSIAQKVYGGGGLHRVRSFLPPGIRTTTPTTPVHGAGNLAVKDPIAPGLDPTCTGRGDKTPISGVSAGTGIMDLPGTARRPDRRAMSPDPTSGKTRKKRIFREQQAARSAKDPRYLSCFARLRGEVRHQ